MNSRSLLLLCCCLLGGFALLLEARDKIDPAQKEKNEKELIVVLDKEVKMKFVLIPAKDKKFWMGSPKSERDYIEKTYDQTITDEEQHEVEFSHDFYMGVFEVKQKEYRALMQQNRSYFCKDRKGAGRVKGLNTDDFPVESVSWKDTQDFLKTLNARSEQEKWGLTFRLPTEAEWEFTCRGGASNKDSKPFHLKDGPTDSLFGDLINFDSEFPYNSDKKTKSLRRTAECGSLKQGSNTFGLSDMHGNVWEWCEDYYDPGFYARSPKRDPLNAKEHPDHKNRRVVRGGSWEDDGYVCRAAMRYGDDAGGSFNDGGFRVVCVRTR